MSSIAEIYNQTVKQFTFPEHYVTINALREYAKNPFNVDFSKYQRCISFEDERLSNSGVLIASLRQSGKTTFLLERALTKLAIPNSIITFVTNSYRIKYHGLPIESVLLNNGLTPLGQNVFLASNDSLFVIMQSNLGQSSLAGNFHIALRSVKDHHIFVDEVFDYDLNYFIHLLQHCYNFSSDAKLDICGAGTMSGSTYSYSDGLGFALAASRTMQNFYVSAEPSEVVVFDPSLIPY